mmetsp:Transcript_15030/g.43698  ORF Transcript_15030/g.43698 Transcript_15030/m.43698 type:complete len:87 (-) Transcript_15030:142-402(-)
MGFLLPANEIPVWYIWLYWFNPMRYIQQGFVVNEIGGATPEGDQALEYLTWSYKDRWWYCYVATLLFGLSASAGIVWATKLNSVKR